MSLAKTGFDFSLMTDETVFVERQYHEEQRKAQTDDDTATDDNGSNT